MDDGGLTGSGLKLYTNAFNTSLLIEALNMKFGIWATFNQTSISTFYSTPIGIVQTPIIAGLIGKHMHPSVKSNMNLK